MYEYRPITQTVKERIELILIEQANTVDTERMDLFVKETANRLLQLFIEEMEHNAPRFR